MKYNVTVKTQQLYNVSTSKIRSPLSLGALNDVDVTGAQNNYVMMYDASTNTYKFVHPSEVLDRADDVDDNSLDYGFY